MEVQLILGKHASTTNNIAMNSVSQDVAAAPSRKKQSIVVWLWVRRIYILITRASIAFTCSFEAANRAQGTPMKCGT